MKFVMSSRRAAEMFAHSAEGFPAEACGFLIGHWSGEIGILEEIVRADNRRADEREDYFEIDPRQYNQVEKALRGSGKQILGFYHSHPNHPDVPSFTDLLFAQGWPGFLWTIIQVVDGVAVTQQTYTVDDSGERFVRVETRVERLTPPDEKREAYARMLREIDGDNT